jgi:hypothetical protein
MGDIWNPFDDNNPIYAKLAKEMKMQRYRVKTGALLLLLIGAGTLYANRNALTFLGTVNQFGVIRRK